MLEIFEEKRLSNMLRPHQRYLEKLQFEMNTLKSWSNSAQDQILGGAHQDQVHLQMMRMIQDIQCQSAPEPWAPGWSSGPSQLPPETTSTCAADSTAFECSCQTSSRTTTSTSISISLEHEQRASQCPIPRSNGRRPMEESQAEPAVSRSNRDLNVLQMHRM